MIAILLLIWNSWWGQCTACLPENIWAKGVGRGGRKRLCTGMNCIILYVGSWCTYNTPSTLEWNWIYSHSIKMIILSECLFHWVVSLAMMNEKEGETSLGCFWFLLLWRITSMWYVAELWWIFLCGKNNSQFDCFFCLSKKAATHGLMMLVQDATRNFGIKRGA
jgi:hypothetical protein